MVNELYGEIQKGYDNDLTGNVKSDDEVFAKCDSSVNEC